MLRLTSPIHKNNEIIFRRTISSYKLLREFSSVATAMNSPSIILDEKLLNSSESVPTVSKNMPRLEELRNRLRSTQNAPLLTQTINSNTKASLSSHNPKKTLVQSQSSPTNNNEATKLSWENILSLAKEQVHTIDDSHTMLTDTYGRYHTYLRISLSERCNLRCQYCMPPEGVPLQHGDALLSSQEINRLVSLFSWGGVNKIRLTGGEPLLRKDLSDIISSISSNTTNMQSIGITTNGITLSRELPKLVASGLTHVNISLDTLKPHKFEEITRRKGLDKVLQSIHDACELLPHGNVKVNCVVMKGFNDDELRDFIEISKSMPLDIRFIEWMPFNENGWSKDRFLSYNDMMNRITSDDDLLLSEGKVSSLNGVGPLQLQRCQDGANDTTKWWKAPGYVGRVGFITSMSDHFCGSCNRVRITADGKIKVCLFGSEEISLRDAMRAGASDDDLKYIVMAALRRKKFSLGGHGSAEGIKKANNNRPMTLIGG
jgi:cyclic pyranopterin phosphate synthase